MAITFIPARPGELAVKVWFEGHDNIVGHNVERILAWRMADKVFPGTVDPYVEVTPIGRDGIILSNTFGGSDAEWLFYRKPDGELEPLNGGATRGFNSLDEALEAMRKEKGIAAEPAKAAPQHAAPVLPADAPAWQRM